MSKLYPIQLVQSELSIHTKTINEYHDELSVNLQDISQLYRPDISLIKSQPELTLDLRAPLLDFLFKVTKRTKLSPGIFYDAVKLFDRYCSKRVVLKSQAQLVGCTCIWIAAKHEGGCNHIVSSLNKPIPNRCQGPTQRSRIPRVIEFVQLCGPSCGYDEGMFIQMERHILNTLEWSVSQISAYNWCFNLHELQLMNDSIDGTIASDHQKMFFVKSFIIELSLYSGHFIMADPANLARLIKKLLSILILNEESHFNIKPNNLQKILDDNKTDATTNTTNNDDNNTCGQSKDSLSFYTGTNDNDEINRLIYSIATVSNTIFQNYTSTDYKEINEMIHKIHKVAVSHIMALKEEEKEIKRQQELYHHQQQIYLNLSTNSSMTNPHNNNNNNHHHHHHQSSGHPIPTPSSSPHYDPERSPDGYSSASSSNSDYEDGYSTFSRKGSETTISSVISSPLPSPGSTNQQKETHGSYLSRLVMRS
ncbi:hypothetical protein DASC09_063610 [Saccharomycopsis crataegensis]|uniref:Cyclin-like domain-containing protein n=1 Tax=Saccharomycopsis crataegensis TaxID=43959 RepID=A0AAV5QX31_9ASCO|nr:hypothetical protein DASC09_063610 [Saccharomycopsis crataegensis]